MLVEVEFEKLPISLKLDVIFSKLLSMGFTVSDIKRESGETSAKIDELLTEVGNATNRLLTIISEKDTMITQLQAGEIDATEAAAQQDALQARMDTEIANLKTVGVTNIQTPE